MSKQKELIRKLKAGEGMTKDETTYWKMIAMFKELANGEGEVKLVSPYFQK